MPIGGRSHISSCWTWCATTPTPITPQQRRLSVEIRLKLYQSDLAPDLLAEILAAWWAEEKPAAVRSSALIEDRADTNFAGQFESFLGVGDDAEFLTSLRACWAALWTTNARRYMAQHGLDPSDTAMAVLVQPLVAARASGGGLSETADGQMLLSRHLGPRLRDRARRSSAGPYRAQPPGFPAQQRSRPQAPSRNLRARRRPRGAGGAGRHWCARPASTPGKRRRSGG